jgi:hypothetical protein
LAKPRSLQARRFSRAEIPRPNPRDVEISQAGPGRQHRGYRQPSPTKYLGDLRSQDVSTYPVRCCPLLNFQMTALSKAENFLSMTLSGI